MAKIFFGPPGIVPCGWFEAEFSTWRPRKITQSPPATRLNSRLQLAERVPALAVEACICSTGTSLNS
ncbi:MAG: hypothetical protein QOF22_1638 [Bradyrhizobium sp.]|jgi:hypothetical protein|nr:hypothetical protein [Bradyrhizobium sp.]